MPASPRMRAEALLQLLESDLATQEARRWLAGQHVDQPSEALQAFEHAGLLCEEVLSLVRSEAAALFIAADQAANAVEAAHLLSATQQQTKPEGGRHGVQLLDSSAFPPLSEVEVSMLCVAVPICLASIFPPK